MRPRLARLVAPLAQEIARAVVEEQGRGMQQHVLRLAPPAPLTKEEANALRESLREQYSRPHGTGRPRRGF